MLPIKNGCALLLSIAAAGCGSSSGHGSASSGGSASSQRRRQRSERLDHDGRGRFRFRGRTFRRGRSAATGDIPDNQVFLVFHNNDGGYSIKYPEGWTQSGSAGDVTFKDKNNLVHVLIARGPARRRPHR